jgi:hypothetical protein
VNITGDNTENGGRFTERKKEEYTQRKKGETMTERYKNA